MNGDLSDVERIARLRLFRSETIGPITFYKLLSRYGTAERALIELPTLSQRGGKTKTLRIMTVEEAEQELSQLNHYGGRMIVFGDAEYPEWLNTIEDAPPVLSIMGDAALLSKSSVAVVGARNASANARRLTFKLAGELGAKGQIIVSGLARGIDTAAHQASLATGTIAVVAGGIDQIYPMENIDLYKDIARQGCIVTEMPFGAKPTAHHFPRRNRIVSGLSKGTLVVEASIKSGSLITARLANEQGRDVFAIPGFPGDPRAAGPNHLIQNGAKLIQNADDIIEELMALDQNRIKPAQLAFDGIAEGGEEFDYTRAVANDTPDNIHETIMQTLSPTPTDIDMLSRDCDIPINHLQIGLLELELAGIVTRHPGNRVSKVA